MPASIQINKIVTIGFLNHASYDGRNTDIIIYHQLRKLLTVHQNDFTFNPIDTIVLIASKFGSCYHHTFLHPMGFHSTCECWDERPTDAILPTFRLYINHVQSQVVLVDDPVDSTIMRFSKVSSSIGDACHHIPSQSTNHIFFVSRRPRLFPELDEGRVIF